MEYTKAIVRELSPAYRNCVSDFPDHHLLNLEKAKEQHTKYIELLQELGLEIIKIAGDKRYPDCCFVEDNAVIYHENAVITRMGVNSRRGEVNKIQEKLSEFKNIKSIEEPGTVEGGDIIHIDNEDLLICGNSRRSNLIGIEQLGKKLGCKVVPVKDDTIVHLKSYVTYLGNKQLLITQKYAEHEVFRDFNTLIVPKKEEYAANSLTINGTVIIPSGYSSTKAMLQAHGYTVQTLNMSEFQKCEGALTCLSLPF